MNKSRIENPNNKVMRDNISRTTEAQQKDFVNYYGSYFGYIKETKHSYSMSLNLGLTF